MRNKFYSFLAVASVIGMASCTNDVELPQEQPIAGEMIDMTVFATLDKGTRTALEEEDGSLKCSWTEGDKLLVTKSDGTRIGYLDLKDPETGEFSGGVLPLENGRETLHYFYLGNPVDENQGNPYPYDFSEQDGKLESIASKDAFSASVEVSVIQNQPHLLGDLVLSRHFAFAHFNLVFPDGVVLPENSEVTISGDNVYSNVNLSFSDGELKEFSGNSIKVSPTNGDFYVTLIPHETVSPTFTAIIGGHSYVGSLGNADVMPSDFFRKGNKTGIEIQMVQTSADLKLIAHLEGGNINGNTADVEKYYDNHVWPFDVTLSEFTNEVGTPELRGYDFAGWTYKDSETILQNVTFEAGETEKEIYAKWTAKTSEQNFVIRLHNNYTGAADLFATYDTKANTWPTTVKIADVNKEIGTPTRKFHKFLGYKENEEGTGSWATQIKFEYDTTSIDLYAQWEAKKYEVTVIGHYNDGTNNQVSTTENKTLPYPFYLSNLDVPTRSGYTFVGWGTSADAKTAETSVYFDDENELTKHVYAIWKATTSEAGVGTPGSKGTTYGN